MGPGWGWDEVGTEPAWDQYGVGMGSLWPRMAPAGSRGPDGRVARSDVTVALGVCAVSSGRSRVPHGCGGGGAVTPTTGCWGGCSPRAHPGCRHWGGGRQWVLGVRSGGVARATPLKPTHWPQLRSLGAASEGLGGCSGDVVAPPWRGGGRGEPCGWGAAAVASSDASGAGAGPPRVRWGEGGGEGDGAGRGAVGVGGTHSPHPLGCRTGSSSPTGQ